MTRHGTKLKKRGIRAWPITLFFTLLSFALVAVFFFSMLQALADFSPTTDDSNIFSAIFGSIFGVIGGITGIVSVYAEFMVLCLVAGIVLGIITIVLAIKKK